MGGDNALDNLEAIGRNCCHLNITADQLHTIAKADRQGGRSGQYARRKKRGSQLKSRGFDKRYKKKLNGKVERNDASED
jgi:S-methylmethionine-dependent homocysteine/selenocysteine methylase